VGWLGCVQVVDLFYREIEMMIMIILFLLNEIGNLDWANLSIH